MNDENHQVYLALPENAHWTDRLHKMGRQIINVLIIIAVVVLVLANKSITSEMALLLGGGNLAYQIVKGKGQA